MLESINLMTNVYMQKVDKKVDKLPKTLGQKVSKLEKFIHAKFAQLELRMQKKQGGQDEQGEELKQI